METKIKRIFELLNFEDRNDEVLKLAKAISESEEDYHRIIYILCGVDLESVFRGTEEVYKEFGLNGSEEYPSVIDMGDWKDGVGTFVWRTTSPKGIKIDLDAIAQKVVDEGVAESIDEEYGEGYGRCLELFNEEISKHGYSVVNFSTASDDILHSVVETKYFDELITLFKEIFDSCDSLEELYTEKEEGICVFK